MKHARLPPPATLLVLGLALQSCRDGSPCPDYYADCNGAQATVGPASTPGVRRAERTDAPDAAPSGVTFASTGAIQTFLGESEFKIALATERKLFLLLPASDTSRPPRVVRLDRGDEGPSGGVGWPNEPLFSPDGKWLAFAGDLSPQSRTASFVREALAGRGWRLPVLDSIKAADPHWYADGSNLYLYVTDVSGKADYNAATKTVKGSVRRFAVEDSALGAPEPGRIGDAAIPGAFKGGISRDGKWVSTSYTQSVLFDVASRSTHLLNGSRQQCNPSINPFPSGSANTDLFLILGFGGPGNRVPTAEGTEVEEGQHENLWIWSKDDKAVWRARLPNTAPHSADEAPGATYSEWQRPEWSTHPDFATATAKRAGTPDGTGYDLFIVKLGPQGGELVAHDRSTTLERGPVLRVASGNFSSTDWSHLWVRQ